MPSHFLREHKKTTSLNEDIPTLLGTQIILDASLIPVFMAIKFCHLFLCLGRSFVLIAYKMFINLFNLGKKVKRDYRVPIVIF